MAGGDIGKWVLERRRKLFKARDRGEGEAGVFWVLPEGQLLISSVPWILAEQYGSHWFVFGFHEKHWESLVKHVPALQGRDYTDYQRGRVSYNSERGVFRILGSRALLADAKVIEKVKREFRLEDKAVELLPDEHYGLP